MYRILTEDQMRKMNAKNLLAFYKTVRAFWYQQRGPSYFNDDWNDYDQDRLNTIWSYKELVKKILDEKEHVLRSANHKGVNINGKTKFKKGREKRKRTKAKLQYRRK